MEAQIEFYNIDEERLVCGQHDRHARTLRTQYGVAFVSRAGFLKITGEDDAVKRVKNVVHRILEKHRSGKEVSDDDVARLIDEAYDLHLRNRSGAIASVLASSCQMR